MDSLLAGTLILPWRVHCAGVMSSAAVPVEKHSGHRESHSGIGRKPFAFPPESLFAFSPESRSSSPRNRFHVRPGILFALPRNPQSDREDQSDPARLGEILCHRPLESVFLIYPRLGREEDTAPSGPGVPASRLRLEAVEQGLAVQNARTLFGVPSMLWAVS